jgi:hypothetical protein
MTTEAILEFEDYPDHEIVVQISPVPVRSYFEIVTPLRTLRHSAESFQALFEKFEPYLVRWTFEQPATAEGLMDVDFKLSIAIIQQWSKGVRDVPLPLPLSASDGTPSEPQAD